MLINCASLVDVFFVECKMKLTVFSFLVLLQPTFFSCAKEVVTLGALIFPPESIIDGRDGMCKGDAVSVTRKIFERSNYKLDIVCTSAARIYRMFNAGDIDFTINIKSTAAIKSKGTFIEPNYHKLTLNLYRRKVDTEMPVVSVIRGFDYHGYKKVLTDQGYNFVSVPNGIDSIRLFHLGRSNILLSYQSTYDYYFSDGNNLPVKSLQVEHLVDVKNYYAVTKSSPKHDQIVKLIKQFAVGKKISSFKSSVLRQDIPITAME